MDEKKEFKVNLLKVIHIVFSFEGFTSLFQREKLNVKFLNPIPKDARLIYFEYEEKQRLFHLFFESEKGTPIKEGQMFTSVPVSDFVIEDLK